MRFHLLGLIFMASMAAPVLAQREPPIDRRIDRLEQEMRAVQRRVFPGANAPYVGAEISEQAPASGPAGVPASGAVADLTGRVDALEAQLRDLTGQVEQNANRLRLMEEGFNRLRESTGSRLEALEGVRASQMEKAPPEPVATRPSPQEARPVPAAIPAAPPVGDEAEAMYNAGFRLWEQKRYPEAQQTLEQVGKRWPNSRWASWANNLAGRAYLDGGKPATAAKLFLANYQGNPKGERAADSLYFLGQALVALKKPADACKAYDELQDVYGDDVRDYLKQRLPAARSEAKCR